MSWVANVSDGKCLGWLMFLTATDLDGKCLRWQVVWMANVSGGNCFVQRRIAFVLVEPQGKGHMWQKFQWQKCFQQYWWMAFVLVALCMSGNCRWKMSWWHVTDGICLHTMAQRLKYFPRRPILMVKGNAWAWSTPPRDRKGN